MNKNLDSIARKIAADWNILFLLLSSLFFLSTELPAQGTDSSRPWTFLTHLTASSISDESDPEGYTIYSSINLEISLRRKINRFLTTELNIGTQSREVDLTDPDGNEVSLGAIELLPINLLLQYHLSLGSWQPYFGAGANYTKIWEKSGTLNSREFSDNFGFVLQLGSDVDILPYALFNFEIKVIDMAVSFETPGEPDTKFELNPFSIGVGLGFRF